MHKLCKNFVKGVVKNSGFEQPVLVSQKVAEFFTSSFLNFFQTFPQSLITISHLLNYLFYPTSTTLITSTKYLNNFINISEDK